MKKIKHVAALAALAVAFTALPGLSSAGASSHIDICPAYGDGSGAGGGTPKIDTPSNPKELTITAPEGYVIVGYCVKGGTQTVYETFEPGVESVTITLPTGKRISHYSVDYEPEGPPES